MGSSKTDSTNRFSRVRRLGTVFLVGLIASALQWISIPEVGAAPAPINGTLSIAAGSCEGGSASGSFFRMILPDGDASGPFLANGESECSDKTVTPLAPGTDGGLRSGSFQPQPEPAFDAQGNALAGSVTRPVKFYGVGFATATNQVDPQTGASTSTPQLFLDGTTITGDLSAFGVTWNNQVFNQGSPKPGGSYSGKTSALTGQYDAASGAYVIQWTSQIVGGPFNNFTGLWRLTGQLSQAPGTATGGQAPAPAQSPAAAPGNSGAVAPSAPAPGAPTPGAPTPPPAAEGAAPAAQQAPATVENQVTLQAHEGGPLSSRWAVLGLLLLTAIATAVLTNADRLFRHRGTDR